MLYTVAVNKFFFQYIPARRFMSRFIPRVLRRTDRIGFIFFLYLPPPQDLHIIYLYYSLMLIVFYV